MAAVTSLYKLLGLNKLNISKNEEALIEIHLYTNILNELYIYYKSVYQNYFHIMKYNEKRIVDMIENNLAKFVLEDILESREYTLQGVATYTDTPEDVLSEIFSGIVTAPSNIIFRRLLELHITVRKSLYEKIKSKIIESLEKCDDDKPPPAPRRN